MPKSLILNRASLSAVATLLLAHTGAAAAQAAAPATGGQQESTPSANGDAPAANDIVVTAQRREQRLQDAPVAVTALSSTALEQLSLSTTEDLMQAVPTLQVSTQSAGDGGGSATFFLRGMGQQQSSNGSEPAVGVYVDDFYYPSLSGAIFDIVDLAQVEALRGPQGTLFGRNTIGGAIRYTTKRPELGSFSGHVTGTVGNYDRYEASGAMNVPIGDFAAIRLTGGHLQSDGYVRIQSTGKYAGGTTTDLVRAQLRIEPTSTLAIDLSGQYSRFVLDGFAYNVPGPITPKPPTGGAAPTLPFIYNATVAGPRGLPLYTDAYKSTCYYCQYGTDGPEFSTTVYKNALATITWDTLPGLSIKSLTGWQLVDNRSSIDFDSTPLPVYGGVIASSPTRAFSQELQINGKLFGDRLNFVAGGYYYNERRPGTVPELVAYILGNRGVPSTITNLRTKSYAGFIDATVALTDRVKLIGGYRYSEDHKELQVVTLATGADRAFAAKTFASSTYRGGIQVEWTDDKMTYATVTTGFRAGGFNPFSSTSATIQPFDPEQSISYEVGARLQFLNRRITVNPSAFYVNWDKIQVQIVTTDSLGRVLLVLQNASTARSYGAELEWSAMVSPALRLFGSFAYLNIHYTALGAAQGITLNSELQRAPPFSFALGGTYTHKLGSGARIVSTLNYSFQDEQRSTPVDAGALELPAYGLLNARIQFVPAGGQFSIAAFMTNILDKKYAVGGVNFYANIGAARIDLGKPRRFGLTARFNF